MLLSMTSAENGNSPVRENERSSSSEVDEGSPASAVLANNRKERDADIGALNCRSIITRFMANITTSKAFEF